MRIGAAALALGLVLAACTTGTDDPRPPATTEFSSTTTTPTALAPTTSTSLGFEVPATIDVAYVQRVLDEIYRLDGEAARYLYAKKLPDAEFNERLEAIFGEPALEESKSVYGRGAASGFVTFANPPGNPEVKVRSIVESTASCILARADLDFRPLFKGSEKTQQDAVVQLSTADILPLNPTGWGVVAAGTPRSGPESKAC